MKRNVLIIGISLLISSVSFAGTVPVSIAGTASASSSMFSLVPASITATGASGGASADSKKTGGSSQSKAAQTSNGQAVSSRSQVTSR